MNAARFKVKTKRGCLCISEGNQLSSEMCHWHFHFILPIIPDKTAFMSADRAAFVYSCSVWDFRAQSANHLFMFGTLERKSFGSVRDFRAQSANHLIKFGTSERTNHLIKFGTSEHRARIIWFSSGL